LGSVRRGSSLDDSTISSSFSHRPLHFFQPFGVGWSLVGKERKGKERSRFDWIFEEKITIIPPCCESRLYDYGYTGYTAQQAALGTEARAAFEFVKIGINSTA